MFGIGSTEFAVFAILFVLMLMRRGPQLRSASRQALRGFAAGCSDRRNRSLPRFALKDVFASTALLAVGMAWIFIALPDLGHSLDHLELPVWSFVIGGAFIGAGVLAPLRMAVVGTILGASVQLLLLYTATSFGWPTF
jgi:hypothetical protein